MTMKSLKWFSHTYLMISHFIKKSKSWKDTICWLIFFFNYPAWMSSYWIATSICHIIFNDTLKINTIDCQPKHLVFKEASRHTEADKHFALLYVMQLGNVDNIWSWVLSNLLKIYWIQVSVLTVLSLYMLWSLKIIIFE